jgi:hypothetical protein
MLSFEARELGAIAQLVERFHGMEEVRGSIPLSSTVGGQLSGGAGQSAKGPGDSGE